MSGYLVCEKHSESFTKACSSCVYDAGVKLAEVIHRDLEATKLQVDGQQIVINGLKDDILMLTGMRDSARGAYQRAEEKATELAKIADSANRLNERLQNSLESIRFGMQKAFGLEYLKKQTEGVTDAGEIKELGAWAWYCANTALQSQQTEKPNQETRLCEAAGDCCTNGCNHDCGGNLLEMAVLRCEKCGCETDQKPIEKRFHETKEVTVDKTQKCECIPGVHKFCPEHGYPPLQPLEGPGSVDE